MRVYETTFILSPQADDATFDRQIKSVSDLIEKHNGTIEYENRMGIRRLAYPIKKFTQGYYAYMVFKGEGELLKELERHFRLEEPFIRNLTVLFERGTIEDLKEHGLSGRPRPSFRHHGRDDNREDSKPTRNEEKTEEKTEEKAKAPADEEAKAEAPVEEAKAEEPKVAEEAPAVDEAKEEPSEDEPKKDE